MLTASYSLAADPDRVIINDLASESPALRGSKSLTLDKCGVTGSSQDITINYALDIRLKVGGANG
jgi:hypothetical protein